MPKKIRIRFALTGLFRHRPGRRRLPRSEERKGLVPEGVRRLIHRAGVRLLRDAREQEIFGSCILLKNLAIVRKDIPLSTDYLLEELMDSSLLLKSIYGEILLRWRSGMGPAAFDIFEERAGSRAAGSFALILAKMDEINPAELVSSMRSFEEAFAGDRMTRAMKRSYLKSLLMTTVSMASVFTVLIDFVIVVVFMDMFAMLADLAG